MSSKTQKGSEMEVALLNQAETLKEFMKIELTKFKSEILDMISGYREQVTSLSAEVKLLKEKVNYLENSQDEIDSYERRDTVILSGEVIPEFSPGEDCPDIVTRIVSVKLGVELDRTSQSTVH